MVGEFRGDRMSPEDRQFYIGLRAGLIALRSVTTGAEAKRAISTMISAIDKRLTSRKTTSV